MTMNRIWAEWQPPTKPGEVQPPKMRVLLVSTPDVLVADAVRAAVQFILWPAMERTGIVIPAELVSWEQVEL